MKKRLYRSRRERKLWGVCGGLAEYFEVDPVIIRVIFIVLAFIQGMGIIAYLVLALVVPNEPAVVTEPPPPQSRPEEEAQVRRGNQRLLGFALIALGGLVLLTNLGWWEGFFWWNPLPALALVILGIVLLLKRL